MDQFKTEINKWTTDQKNEIVKYLISIWPLIPKGKTPLSEVQKNYQPSTLEIKQFQNIPSTRLLKFQDDLISMVERNSNWMPFINAQYQLERALEKEYNGSDQNGLDPLFTFPSFDFRHNWLLLFQNEEMNLYPFFVEFFNIFLGENSRNPLQDIQKLKSKYVSSSFLRSANETYSQRMERERFEKEKEKLRQTQLATAMQTNAPLLSTGARMVIADDNEILGEQNTVLQVKKSFYWCTAENTFKPVDQPCGNVPSSYMLKQVEKNMLLLSEANKLMTEELSSSGLSEYQKGLATRELQKAMIFKQQRPQGQKEEDSGLVPIPTDLLQEL
jgi:hypothetical protein